MEASPSWEAKFPELYGIRILTEELATRIHLEPNSSRSLFPQVFYNDLLYFHSPNYTQAFQVVLLPFSFLTKTLYAFFQSPVHISVFAYLVVLDVVILMFCRQHKSCGSSPRNVFQSPVTSSLVGPISSSTPPP